MEFCRFIYSITYQHTVESTSTDTVAPTPPGTTGCFNTMMVTNCAFDKRTMGRLAGIYISCFQPLVNALLQTFLVHLGIS